MNFCSSVFKPSKEFGVNFKSLQIKLPKMNLPNLNKKDQNEPAETTTI